MLRIETGKATLQARYILATSNGKNIVTVIKTDEPLSKIAEYFEKNDVIRSMDEGRDSVYTVYEGYTELTNIQRMNAAEVRVMLAKPAEEV